MKGRTKLGAGCGLVGSALALAVWLVLPPMGNPAALGLSLLSTAIAIILSHLAQEYYGHRDDSRIVIDEFAGYLWAVAFVPKTAGILAAAFVLFRILDVTKPLGIRKIENLPGGWGCVLDDVASGLATATLIGTAIKIL